MKNNSSISGVNFGASQTASTEEKRQSTQTRFNTSVNAANDASYIKSDSKMDMGDSDDKKILRRSPSYWDRLAGQKKTAINDPDYSF